MPKAKRWTAIEIRRLRIRLRMSPLRFSQLIGVNQATVYRWEAATPKPVPAAQAIMTAIREVLDRYADREDAVIEFVQAAVFDGGLEALLVKLFDHVYARE